MTTQASLTRAYKTASNISNEAGDVLPQDINVQHPDYGKMIERAHEIAGRVSGLPQEQKEQLPETKGTEPEAKEAAPEGKEEAIAPKEEEAPASAEKLFPEYRVSPKEQKIIDHDDEPYGHDISDKMTMLGALATGGVKGVADIAARAVQLVEAAGEHVPTSMVLADPTGEHVPTSMVLADPTGMSAEFAMAPVMSKFIIGGKDKNFTDWYNRTVVRNSLVKEAQHSHPIVEALGEFAGGAAVLSPLLAGFGALATGGALVGRAAKAIETVSNIAETVGGEGAFSAAIDGATQRAAAKMIINAKKITTPLKLANMVGQGAIIGEMQYDPENNHYISQAAIGGVLGLAGEAGGKIIRGFGGKVADEITKLGDKFGISLPIKPNLEKIAKYMPFSGYGKLMTERAQQFVKKLEEVSGGIIGAGKKAIAEDLDSRMASTTTLLSDPSIKDYARKKATEQLAELTEQKSQIGTKAGYSQYLYGKAKDNLSKAKEEWSGLDGKVYESVKNAPDIETPNTNEIAQKTVDDFDQIGGALRKSSLIVTCKSILANGVPENLKRIGIKNAEDMAVMVEGVFNGKLKSINKNAYEAINPYLKLVHNELVKAGVPVTKDEIHSTINSLIGANRSFDNFKLQRTMIGQKLETAANSVEKGHYGRLYGALTEDLRNYVRGYGGKDALNLFDKQNALYHDTIAPLRNMVDKYSGKTEKNADTFIGQFLKPDQPNEISKILSQMSHGDETSKLALKAAIMHSAYQDALIDSVGINPIKWINEVERLGETNNIVFSKEENEVFKGYKKLVDYVHRISPDALVAGAEKGITKPTGEAVRKVFTTKHVAYLGAAALGMKIGGGALLPFVMGGTAFARLVTTKTGRKILSRIYGSTEKEKTNNAVRDALKYLGVYSAIAGMAKTQTGSVPEETEEQ